MTNGKRLCLNMIVRNEMANLERCLAAAAPHIACWVIGDTGSSDGTQDFIMKFFAARGLSGELHSFPFDNFEQARNAALDCAYASPLGYDYLLFADADMELVVEDPDFRDRLEAPGYRLIQRTASGLTYGNTRLVRRDVRARYHGVTHEYIEVPGGVEDLRGVRYTDHATGSNRVDKFERDIRLLSEALKEEPENSRYWFYLAQSYRDAGRIAEAAETYSNRAGMGGWDEEAWYARLQEARCLRDLGDDGGFLRAALQAFNQRPQRAEPLYDLTRFYRQQGLNDASVLFSEAGLMVARPEEDVLFLEDFVYTAGLKEEYSIAANYSRDKARKDRGHAACNWLALSRDVPSSSRALAWSNLRFYTEPAAAMMPSFAARPVGFTPPDGYRPMNPSVARCGDQIALVQRAVNFTLDEKNEYHTPNGEPIRTRNFLLRLNATLEIEASVEILPPRGMPKAKSAKIVGFEDMRLFAWNGALWCCATLRELTPEGWCEQVLARIDEPAMGECRLTDWHVLHPEGPRLHEKNWMPQIIGGRLQFVYSCDPTRVVDAEARTVVEATPAIAADLFRGGSQVIALDGGWLALIHEVLWVGAESRRYYRHRFVWFDDATTLRRVSRAFYFHAKGIEFAAGLAWHPDGTRLIISYGVGDGESWIATVQASDVRNVLEDAGRLPSGRPVSADQTEQDGARGNEVTMPGSMTPVEVSASVAAAGDNDQQVAAGVAATSAEQNGGPAGETAASSGDYFLALAPYLRAVDTPVERRALSRAFDARIAPFLNGGDITALPQIHCFYEALSDTAQHHTLIAATTSMRAMGHPVRVWSYSPEKLEFLRPHGIEVRPADDVVPRGLFKRIVAGSEIRYFSDVFRYAVLYEQGGLWMDSDVVMLRPFPFHGEHFLNLQWRGGHKGHFVCGNVMYAKPFSPHLRNLYETSIERFLGGASKEFGDIGPKLLSDYVASEAGAELKEWLFSPMFFNSIDWTEVDRFNRPIGELADYLNDERVFGIHLWNARTNALSRDEGASLISLLTDPLVSLPRLTDLADRFDTDKNRHTGNRHFYARVYDRLLSPCRFSARRLMEIGLCRGLAESDQPNMPSVELWQTYFPFCHVTGVDLTDFSRFDSDRFSSITCDQSQPDQVRSVAERIEPGAFDVIIDDGSHASYDQQITLREFFPLLADGGWYLIEDLDWQPPGEDPSQVPLTKHLLREIQQNGAAPALDPLGIGGLFGQFAAILFFDSHYELQRANLLGGLVAIRKRGGTGLVA